MNLVESFAQLMETLTGATLGQDLRIGEAPSSNQFSGPIWWVVGRGGTVTLTNATGERTKERIIEVYYRDSDYKNVYDAMQAVEEELNCVNCVGLEDYIVDDITAQPLFIDNDIDQEDRKVGLLQVNITTYQPC